MEMVIGGIVLLLVVILVIWYKSTCFHKWDIELTEKGTIQRLQLGGEHSDVGNYEYYRLTCKCCGDVKSKQIKWNLNGKCD